jgi:hypothetical protein
MPFCCGRALYAPTIGGKSGAFLEPRSTTISEFFLMVSGCVTARILLNLEVNATGCYALLRENRRAQHMTGPKIAEVMSAVEQDDNLGFCSECGAEHYQIEPDARNYPCDECGNRAVFGAEQYLIECV